MALCLVLPFLTGAAAVDSGGPAVRYEQAVKLGDLRWKEGQFEEALAWYLEARELGQKSKDAGKTARCAMPLGRLCWAVGRPEESRKYYEEALAGGISGAYIREAEKTKLALAVLELYSRGKAERLAGELGKAVLSLGEACEQARKLEAPEIEVKCLRQLSFVQWDRKDWPSYIEVNSRYLQIAREIRDRKEQARCMLNLAAYHLRSNSFEEALEWYSLALGASLDVADKTTEYSCRRNIAVILMELGYYERSLDYLSAANELGRQIGDSRFSAHDLNALAENSHNKGRIFSNNEDLYAALDDFMQALEAARQTGDEKMESLVLNNIGRLHADLGKYRSALHYLESAWEQAAVQDAEVAVEILDNMGLCHLRLGDYGKALQLLSLALDRGSRMAQNRILWKTVFHLGESYEKQGSYEAALACYRSSIQAIEFLRSRILADEYKCGFARDKLKVYESLISLLFSLDRRESGGSSREIFQVAERAKARAFLETLEKKDTRQAQNSGDLDLKEAEISRLITVIIGELENKTLPPKRREELDERLRQAEESYIRMTSGHENTPESTVVPRPIELEEVQKALLDDKTAILEFFLGESRSFLFLITKESFRIFPLASRQEIESSLSPYLELLSTRPKGPWKGFPAGRRLFRELLAGALDAVPAGVEQLIIIPDGVLCGLPFETLSLPSETSKVRYLVSAYAVSYAPSCSSLLFIKGRPAPTRWVKGLLAFGNPLYPQIPPTREKGKINAASLAKDLYAAQGFELVPLDYSEHEVKSIAAFFPEGKKDVYVSGKATEENFKRGAPGDYAVIHFACHGYQDDRVPFRSGLFLSLLPDRKEDGFLQAREIVRSRLNAGLVVLSACRSSRGYTERGEGTMGLVRSFFYAGARSVLSSLWEVSDRASAELMRGFYGQLNRKVGKAQALRMAKLSLLESKYDHPFYWAGFVLHGETFSDMSALY